MRRWSLFSFLPSRAFVSSVIIGIVVSRAVAAGVVINEVYYDHPGRDDGWEFVELHNPDTIPCALAGWALETLDGATGAAKLVWTASPGAIIGPGGFLCIAGIERAPAAGLLLRGTLGNGPDAIRLVSPSGAADLVGYGACASGDLFEAAPAQDVSAGSCLARKPDGHDSGRNDEDFVPALPTPGRRNFFRFDIGMSIPPADALPCRGSLFPLKTMIANCGLEPARGSVSILSDVIADGCGGFSGVRRYSFDLAVSAVDSFELILAAPEAIRFAIRARFDRAVDENPANDSVRAFLGASPGAIVVNEIMYRPAIGMSEWIELVNVSGADRNLKGWTLCDATGSRRLISAADAILPPGTFAILARDSASFAFEFPLCAAPVRGVEGGWPSLNDADGKVRADAVSLHDESGMLVEAVSYRDLLGDERGRSIERVSADACSGRAGGIWHRCAAKRGATPGDANSTRVDQSPRSAGLFVSPNPFSPRRDGEVSVAGTRVAGETGFLARIFDREGYEVARLFGESGGADIFSCRWDGRTSDGRIARTGLYVCLVEYIEAGGVVCRREKACIVVAGD